ncbi:lysozyme [Altererythrobacter sp. SALINAS58]|uniref:lysozyme n=1 Tax=Alteripontixanthobacter muriae TaxID=2705546 RepID=UPI001576BB60|nr:lysozyme [Alteripontixanthobacter muriae]NTZ42216.1 lysozyme [Alteripontixanthobacter muriae]
MQRKTIFDAVRNILGRGFRASEVIELDLAIENALGREDSGDLSSSRSSMISAEGIALIKKFEGCAKIRRDGLVEAYPDPGSGGDPWTIGWGATGTGIARGTLWTQDQCDARLVADLASYSQEVARAIGGAPTSQAEFDALVSFHYNTGAIARATLTKHHRAGRKSAAAAEFARWNRAAGNILPGLVNRRRAEAALYSQG